MSLRNTHLAYGSVAKFFHWATSVLIILMLVFGFFLEDVPKDYQPTTYNLHKLTGLTILLLMLMRLTWTLMNPKPALPADTLAWQRYAERVVHFMLYLFAILMPLVGWVGSVAGGRPPRVGDFYFNLPIAPNKALAEAAFETHELVAFILIFLISVHALAAMYHHYVKRDNILRRMLPGGE